MEGGTDSRTVPNVYQLYSNLFSYMKQKSKLTNSQNPFSTQQIPQYSTNPSVLYIYIYNKKKC
jgi:hypothetical protein